MKSFHLMLPIEDISSNYHIELHRKLARVEFVGNAERRKLDFRLNSIVIFTLNRPAAKIGWRSSLFNERFRSILSIQSLTERALATLRKMPTVSGPLA